MNKYTLGGCAFLWKVGSNLSNKLLKGISNYAART